MLTEEQALQDEPVDAVVLANVPSVEQVGVEAIGDPAKGLTSMALSSLHQNPNPYQAATLELFMQAIELVCQEDGAMRRAIRQETYLGSSYNPDISSLKPKAQQNQQRLKKLSDIQFTELATDVQDEVTRQQEVKLHGFSVHLSTDIQARRLKARDKLASLPEKRFIELANSVVLETERRFPTCIVEYSMNSDQTFVVTSPSTQTSPTRKDSKTTPNASRKDSKTTPTPPKRTDSGIGTTRSVSPSPTPKRAPKPLPVPLSRPQSPPLSSLPQHTPKTTLIQSPRIPLSPILVPLKPIPMNPLDAPIRITKPQQRQEQSRLETQPQQTDKKPQLTELPKMLDLDLNLDSNLFSENFSDSVFSRVSASLKRMSIFQPPEEVTSPGAYLGMDNLLADLDVLILTSRNTRNNKLDSTELMERERHTLDDLIIEKTKQEYDEKIAQLKKQIVELKKTARMSVAANVATNEERGLLLEDDLAEEYWFTQEHTAHIESLRIEIQVNSDEVAYLRKECEYQSQFVRDIKKEAKGLRNEITNLKKTKIDLQRRSDRLDVELSKLEIENKRLKERIKQREVENFLKMFEESATHTVSNEREGVINPDRVKQYQSAAKDLLIAISSSEPYRFSLNNTSMKFFSCVRRIILACHSIMEDIQAIRMENTHYDITYGEQVIDENFEVLQVGLEGLMAQVKSLSVNPSELENGSGGWKEKVRSIEKAMEELDYAVITMVRPFGVVGGGNLERMVFSR
ncbi:component of the polarisome [Nowakowskiella sp. JEL0407]|nr:component of the polarisome [Nowakowskiella sp. JEL0407]